MVGINMIDPKTLRLQPIGEGLDIVIRDSELLSNLFGGKPLVEIGGLLVVKRIDQLLERLFLLRRTLQLQKHVLDLVALRNRAPIVHAVRLRTGVARKRHQIALINGLRDASRNDRTRARKLY